MMATPETFQQKYAKFSRSGKAKHMSKLAMLNNSKEVFEKLNS